MSWEHFGYETDQVCGICGQRPAKVEPRFGYNACETHSKMSPLDFSRTSMRIDIEESNRMVYDKSPSYCEDCGCMLDFEIRSNRRCIFCYQIERDWKDSLIIPDNLLDKWYDR